jgi:pimeloyl-ACP methyl ester carboxylesterase
MLKFLQVAPLLALGWVAGAAASAKAAEKPDTTVHHRTVTVDGLDIFYREAGAVDRPTLLLLHGFPSSSHMFRNLIPLLADRYHVIAPDYPGFGYSSMPTVKNFEYTFDHLALVVDHFTQAVGLKNYTIYVQDYGAPVGFRLAAAHPERITGIIVQNGNAYLEGVGQGLQPLLKYGTDQNAENEAVLRKVLTMETTKFQYTHGVSDPSRVDPDSWTIDQAQLDRPGNAEIQLALFKDYRSNVALYPQWHDYFKSHQPPTLVVWGQNDPFFTVDGAKAYARDNPNVELHLLDTGHFVLEDQLGEATQLIRAFLATHLDK